MQDAPAFDFVCESLERLTSMSLLQARGTVRLVLRAAGLEPHRVTADQLVVVIERLLGAALRSRGISDDALICSRLKERLLAHDFPARPEHDSPEEILRRFSLK